MILNTFTEILQSIWELCSGDLSAITTSAGVIGVNIVSILVGGRQDNNLNNIN